MCTSIVTNFKKTIVGWNLDLLDMEWKVVSQNGMVAIMIFDKAEGWLPLFGANNRGDFVAMPTCWPFDNRSDKTSDKQMNIINLDIDLLTKKKLFNEILEFVKTNDICSVSGVTFQSQLSNKNGDVVQIVPGQGYKFFKKPKFAVLTNFSPFKMDKEIHPWMGLDRNKKANEMLEHYNEDFFVHDMFEILKATSQKICPTVVSMVFDVTENIVYWCENQNWNKIQTYDFNKN